MTKGDDDEQMGAANDQCDGVAECDDDEYRLLWSVQSDEECLSLEQQCQRQRTNQRQMDEGNRILRHVDCPGVHVLRVTGYLHFQLDAFWTGDSPIKESDLGSDGTKVATLGDTTVRWTALEDGAMVAYERHGVVQRRATIVASAMGYRLVDESGNVLSEAEYAADGSVRLLNGECQVVKQLSQEQLRAIAGDRLAMVPEASR